MAEYDAVQFGNYLRSLRIDVGSGLRETARYVGMSPTLFSRVERGVHPIEPQDPLLEKFAMLLQERNPETKVTKDYLFAVRAGELEAKIRPDD